jgi:hypothetical protein
VAGAAGMSTGGVLTDADVALMVGNDRLGWMLDVVARFRSLPSLEDRLDFWEDELDEAPPLAAAALFMFIWNSERYWDADPEHARTLLLFFNMIEDRVVRAEPESMPLVRLIKEACPYLVELHDSDENWTAFDLPGELRALE